jgi:DNA-binding response OmpR family regulator
VCTAELRSFLEEAGAEVQCVFSLADARRKMEANSAFQAIICAGLLPDGGFHDVISLARKCPGTAPVFVCVLQTDGGWSDWLEAGAADLIVGPDLRAEVRRVLNTLPRYRPVPLAAAATPQI